MQQLAIFNKHDSLQESLHTVSGERYDTFNNILNWWYVEKASRDPYTIPNVDMMLEEENPAAYIHMFFEVAYIDLCVKENWHTDEETRRAFNILTDFYEQFAIELKEDLVKVMDTFEMFYESGSVTMNDGNGRVSFVAAKYHNAPLQEVW